MPFLVLFILIPFLELWTFIQVSSEIGFFKAVFLAFLAAAIGTAIVQQQGLQTVLALRTAIDRSKAPLNEVFDGFCITAAGILMIIPGFLSDILGFILLIPPVRARLRSFLLKHTDWNVSASAYDSEVIEGEYERVDDDPKSLR
jgi:UPF0716 protein FxsA